MKVIYPDGRTDTVVAGPKAQVLAERQLKSSLLEKKTLEQIYCLAFHASILSGLVDHSTGFDHWLDSIEDVDMIDDEDDESEDPTKTGPSPDVSSS
jgi:hypothetical protein